MNSRIALVLALAGTVVTTQAQTCNPHIRHSAPNLRYAVNAQNGTVLDRQTGLMWKRCVEGQSGADCGSGSPTRLNWGSALTQAAASTFAGYKDWRIPNSKELESLVEVACEGPAINATVLPNDPNTDVWASSPSAGSADLAWSVYFFNGNSNYYDGSRHYLNCAVRLVRGGQ